jgi:glycosyltransferase involved in cell wall biosynthesis
MIPAIDRAQGRQATRRLHVLMLWGEFTFVQDWAHAASRSADVTLAFQKSPLGKHQRERGPGAERFARVEIARLHLRPSRALRPVSRSFEVFQIERLLRTLEAEGRAVDCIHTHFFNNADAAVVAGRRHGIPVVHTEHSSSLVGSGISPSASRLLREVTTGSAAVFAVSEPLREAMCALGVGRDIEVLANPVDVNSIASRQVTAPYPPIGGRLRLVSAGWLIPRKRHEDLIRMMALLRAEWPHAELHIIGDGLLEAHLHQVAHELDLADQVVFHGRLTRDAVLEVFADSHVYVHASSSETYGVTLVEAWASGLPVVTYRCGGVSSMADGLHGEAVGTRSPAALAAAVERVAAHLSLGRRQAVRQAAMQQFDVGVIERRLAETYARVTA